MLLARAPFKTPEGDRAPPRRALAATRRQVPAAARSPEEMGRAQRGLGAPPCCRRCMTLSVWAWVQANGAANGGALADGMQQLNLQ